MYFIYSPQKFYKMNKNFWCQILKFLMKAPKWYELLIGHLTPSAIITIDVTATVIGIITTHCLVFVLSFFFFFLSTTIVVAVSSRRRCRSRSSCCLTFVVSILNRNTSLSLSLSIVIPLIYPARSRPRLAPVRLFLDFCHPYLPHTAFDHASVTEISANMFELIRFSCIMQIDFPHHHHPHLHDNHHHRHHHNH